MRARLGTPLEKRRGNGTIIAIDVDVRDDDLGLHRLLDRRVDPAHQELAVRDEADRLAVVVDDEDPDLLFQSHRQAVQGLDHVIEFCGPAGIAFGNLVDAADGTGRVPVPDGAGWTLDPEGWLLRAR